MLTESFLVDRTDFQVGADDRCNIQSLSYLSYLRVQLPSKSEALMTTVEYIGSKYFGI